MDDLNNLKDIEELVKKILQAKKYKSLAEEVVKAEVSSLLKSNPRWREYKEKFILKQIKAQLHKIHGSFQIDKKTDKKRQELLEKLEENPENIDIIQDMLETNSSTKERVEIYSDIYTNIFELTGIPNSILDLGGGINPVSFYYMGLDNKTNYYAYDINEKDKDFLNEFFKIESINGKADTINLRRIESIKRLPSSDICFMFKVLDVLEKKGHKYSEELIKALFEYNKCRFIVVSFATKTITGKSMNYPYRGWIERMLQRVGFNFEILKFENEIFYVISSKKPIIETFI